MSIFSINSPLYRGMDKLVRIVYLGVLWFVFSLPVVTMGASFIAMYEVVFEMADGRDCYIFRSFFRAFKSNLRQGIVPGDIGIVLIFLVGFNTAFYLVQEDGFIVEKVCFTIWMVVLSAVVLWLFPVMAKFSNTAGGHVRMAAILAIKKPLWTIVFAILHVMAWVLCAMYFYFPLIFAMGIVCFLEGCVCNKVFEDMIKRGEIVKA